MKNLKFTLLTILMLVLGIGVMAQEKVLQIKILEKDKERVLQAIGLLQIDHHKYDNNGNVVAVVTERDLRRLKGTGLRYEVTVGDANKKLLEDNLKALAAEKAGIGHDDDHAHARGAFQQSGKRVDQIIQQPAAFVLPATVSGYWSYNQMVTLIGNLKNTYPTIVDTFGIGFTYENRRILVVKISDNVTTDESEPEVLFLGLQHAREAIGGSSMIFLMQYLAERYQAGDAKIQNLVQNREIFIIPCFNADGWQFNWSSGAGSMWRKNRRPQAGGEIGVDLNRNWGVDWSNCSGATTACGSNDPAQDTYYGTSAFSEPETRAVRDWVYTRNFTAMIDQHSFGPYYSLPFGRPSLHTMSADDANYYTRIPSMMGLYNGMRAGNSPQSVNYEVAGGVKDWMLMGNIGTGTKGKIYGMTGEGGAAGGDASGNDFWPRRDSIVRLCKGMTYQNLQLILAAGSYANIQDQGNMSITGPDRWGNFDFEVRRIGIGDDPITVSMIPLENVLTAGAPVVINSLPYYGTATGSVSFTLPWTMNNGQRFRYIWRVQTGGIQYDDTVTKFFNPTQILFDDMENTGAFASNWTVTGTWNYSTNGTQFAGSRSLQESPAGNYATNSNMVATRTTQLDLSNATQAYLSFWVRHRAENGRDKLRVEISLNNGGAWLTIPAMGSHTVQEYNDGDGSTMGGLPGLTGIRDIWTRVSYDLSSYGGAGRTQVRFRLAFTSDGDATAYAFDRDEGFYIDNMQVIKSTVPMSTLPVRFLDVRGKLLQNRTIEVSWEAETDAQHSYFEVERSADGTSFSPIGKVTTVGNPYRFIDNTPLIGNNYYRIKQYDKDGNFNFSQVVLVKNVYKGGVQIYPNPLTDNDLLTIRPDGNFNSPVNLRITDAQGRVVYQKFINDFSKEIKINTAGWSPQIYVLKITNNRGEFVTVEKIMKK
jgi:carboxypeptidase T